MNFSLANEPEPERAVGLVISLRAKDGEPTDLANPQARRSLVRTRKGSPSPQRQGRCLLLSHRYTLIPTSIVLGLGAAPLWSAQCTYLTIMGNTQAEKVGKVGRDVVNQYFGIFFLIFQSSGVWGNLISSLVFGQTPTQGKRSRGSVMAPERPPSRSHASLFHDKGRCTTRHGARPLGPSLSCAQLFSWAVYAALGVGLVHRFSSLAGPALPEAGECLQNSVRGNGGHCHWNLGSQSHHRPFGLRTGSTDLLSH